MPAVDVLIVGSGISGLSAAIKIAKQFPDREICIVTKDAATESNTQYAQGGISVVVDLLNDSAEAHIQDTMYAGDGLCDEKIVKFVVEQAPDRLSELIDYGVEFDRDSLGRLSLAREGGHRKNRIVHCKDATGVTISTVLLSMVSALPNIKVLTNHIALDLITKQAVLHSEAETCCRGATVLDRVSGVISNFFSRVTILATGGVGQLYHITTNPLVATGDGIAIASGAGAEVSNMEFIQFHPTALASFDINPCFLISEAVRGHGAHLINSLGERFMFRYHPDGELACRDIVSRAIAMEMTRVGSNEVLLDCTHIASDFPDKFPNIYQKCKDTGLDLNFRSIPVAPAAHYVCGGINVDKNGRTTIENLYACGECAHTGLHGANRLASNSLLEAMVFAHACYEDIAKRLDQIPLKVESVDVKTAQVLQDKEMDLVSDTREKIRKIMTEQVGIVRSRNGLISAKHCLSDLSERINYLTTTVVNFDLQELKNMISVAQLIVDQSLQRKMNCGVFFNTDLTIPDCSPLSKALQE